MSRVRADRYTNRAGTGSPTFSEGVNVVGISSLGITTVTGVGQTALTVNGDARITGVLTVGQGSVTIGSTNITTQYINDIQYPTAGPLSNRNLVINGAMVVAQRGTSSTTSNYGTVDRFACYFGGGAQTQTQETLTSGDPYNEGFRYFLRIANTTASTGAGDSRQIMTKLEAQNVAQSGWNYTSSTSYVTVSFWIRASVSQEYYGYFQTRDGTEQIYPFSLGTLSANTWTKVTKTVPGNSNITINNNNGEGLRLVLSPFWGTDYTDSGVSLDTWAAYASGTRTPDYTNTWAGTTDATFDLTGVQLEVGERSTPFEHRSYGEELALCQRYCYMIGRDTTYAHMGMGQCNSTTVGRALITFPQTMRTEPSFITSGSFLLTNATNAGIGIESFAEDVGSRSTYTLTCTVASGLVAGNSTRLAAENDTSAYILFSAEL